MSTSTHDEALHPRERSGKFQTKPVSDAAGGLNALGEAMPRPPLNVCAGCGRQVSDFESNGFERRSGQRGHLTCPNQPAPDEPGDIVLGADVLWAGTTFPAGTELTPMPRDRTGSKVNTPATTWMTVASGPHTGKVLNTYRDEVTAQHWVYIERDDKPDLAVGPYTSQSAAVMAMEEADLIEGLAGDDALEVLVASDRPGDGVERQVIDPDDPCHLGVQPEDEDLKFVRQSFPRASDQTVTRLAAGRARQRWLDSLYGQDVLAAHAAAARPASDGPLTSDGGAYPGDLTDHADPDHGEGGVCTDCQSD